MCVHEFPSREEKALLGEGEERVGKQSRLGAAVSVFKATPGQGNPALIRNFWQIGKVAA